MSDPETFSRIARVQSIDADAGTFGMTLATEGEASDGHILSIEGGSLTERMPLLLSHWNDPTAVLGTISRTRKRLSENPPRLEATGTIELTGDGALADVRRDVMHMISRGHVGAVSIRWDADAKDSIPRIDLPKDHPFHVSRDKEPVESPKRHGRYFKRWRPVEGSVVALGADPLALIGRADETDGEVSAFWREMAQAAMQRPDPSEFDSKEEFMAACMSKASDEGHDEKEAAGMCNAMWEERKAPAAPSREALEAAFSAQIRELMTQHGIGHESLADILESQRPKAEPTLPEALSRISALEARLAAVELSRVPGEPAPPMGPKALVESIQKMLQQERESASQQFLAKLEKARGKVLDK